MIKSFWQWYKKWEYWKQKLAEELQKPIIRKLRKVKYRKVHSSFIDNIWGADKFNKGIHFLLCVIDISLDTLGLFLWKIKKVLQLLTLFKHFWKNLIENQSKILIDKGSEFCNNNIEMYSMHNEGKPAVAEGFVRALKNKIYKHMTSTWKNVLIN